MKLQLFDLDGTLLDSNGIWYQIDLDFLSKRGIPWSEEYNQGVIHAIFPTAAKFTKEFLNLPESEEEIMAEWLSMAYEAYSEKLPLKAGVADYLEQCRKMGASMAIYTACEPRLCAAALARHGLTEYFSNIIYAQELGVEKRSPGAFHAVLERLGTRAENCVFYDDNPLSCKSALDTGLTVVGVYDSLFAQNEAALRGMCHRYIRSFQELLDDGLQQQSDVV